jgi:hypothetical protein
MYVISTGCILNSVMPELNHERILDEAAALEELRKGGVLKTVGKVLLWVELVPLAFVYMSIRAGARLILWWAILEGVLGLALLIVGWRKRVHALAKLGVVSRTGPTPEWEYEAEQKPRIT